MEIFNMAETLSKSSRDISRNFETVSVALEDLESLEVPEGEVWVVNILFDKGYRLNGKLIQPDGDCATVLLEPDNGIQAVGNIHISGFVLIDQF